MKCPYCGKENDGFQCTKCHADIRVTPTPVKKPEPKTKKEEKERS